ncbi:MAG: Gfo/Idh/MocA family oxidoreductase [Chloroflexota bacterium]|nr:MAG: Gfo/Idh/MocA family oxidoreductase [Chloroflexota bacterium]
MADVRVAVIGLAWGQLHIDALRRIKNLDIVAVCDADENRAKVVAKNAGIKFAFSNPNEIFSRDEIELVTIATPPNTQKELANKAMLAKKTVLVESPAGLNSQEAKALLETSQQRKIKNAVAFQTRYLPSYAYAKELIDEEYLGQFLRATITFVMAQPWGLNGNWAADEKRGGGVMRNVAVHFLDALQWWFGPVQSVFADRETLFSEVRRPVTVGREQKIEKFTATADDTFLSLLKFENGGIAILNFITGARQDQPWNISLVGSRATLQITSGTLAGKRDTERDFGLIEIPRRLELPDRPREPLMWALCELATDFTKQIQGVELEGRAPPTFDDALKTHKVMEAIQRSADDMLWAAV